MKPITFHPEAEDELKAAIDYYDRQRDGLGAELQEAVERASEVIGRIPQAFSLHNAAGVRKFVLQRFPYCLFYLELDESVWVVAVAHQKRQPNYWAHRQSD